MMVANYSPTPIDRSNSSASSCQANTDEDSYVDSSYEVPTALGQLAEDLLMRESQVDWITSLLCERIRHVVAQNAVSRKGPRNKNHKQATLALSQFNKANTNTNVSTSSIPLGEVADILPLPPPVSSSFRAATEIRASWIKLPDIVTRLTREFVSVVAAAHHPNHPFGRTVQTVVCANALLENQLAASPNGTRLLDDPIVSLAVLWAALVHAVDHDEGHHAAASPWMAQHYRHDRVAAQHALDVAWLVWSDAHFGPLRTYVLEGPQHEARFRQAVVQGVLTMNLQENSNDKRDEQWQQVFANEQLDDAESNEALRTTLLLERVLQTSHICPALQKWPIFRHYQQLRLASADPRRLSTWFQAELDFLDEAAIPLIQKLKDSKIFGRLCDGFLKNALHNRRQWKNHGESLVGDYMPENSVLHKLSSATLPSSLEEQIALLALANHNPFGAPLQ